MTFGGSSLDRAAHLRGDLEALAAHRINSTSEAIVFWRGKPLIRRGPRDALARLPMIHPLIAERAELAIFLGLEGEQAIFAHDLSRVGARRG